MVWYWVVVGISFDIIGWALVRAMFRLDSGNFEKRGIIGVCAHSRRISYTRQKVVFEIPQNIRMWLISFEEQRASPPSA